MRVTQRSAESHRSKEQIFHRAEQDAAKGAGSEANPDPAPAAEARPAAA